MMGEAVRINWNIFTYLLIFLILIFLGMIYLVLVNLSFDG